MRLARLLLVGLMLVGLDVRPAQAVTAQIVTRLLLPSYGGGLASDPIATANQLLCGTVTARFAHTTATKLAGKIAVGVDTATCAFAVYPDNDAATALGRVSAACDSASAFTISATGLPVIPIDQGARYRICVCASVSGVRYLSPYHSERLAVILNGLGSPLVGTAANSCSAGVAPTTTGALTAASIQIPYVELEE